MAIVDAPVTFLEAFGFMVPRALHVAGSIVAVAALLCALYHIVRIAVRNGTLEALRRAGIVEPDDADGTNVPSGSDPQPRR